MENCMESNKIILKGNLLPIHSVGYFLSFAWAVLNNLTDTMLAAFSAHHEYEDSKQLGYR